MVAVTPGFGAHVLVVTAGASRTTLGGAVGLADGVHALVPAATAARAHDGRQLGAVLRIDASRTSGDKCFTIGQRHRLGPSQAPEMQERAAEFPNGGGGGAGGGSVALRCVCRQGRRDVGHFVAGGTIQLDDPPILMAV
jgi:hypothetical protein